MLRKESAYVKSCDRQTKWMCFLMGDGDLLEIHYCYNTIWVKVSTNMKK